MLTLVGFFFDLCLLRKAPQDLPASWTLMALALTADLLAGALVAAAVGLPPGLGLSSGLLEAALMLAFLYGALNLAELVPRFQQSATALLGSGAIIGIFATVALGLVSPAAEGRESAGAGFVFLALLAWSILVTGHILRHTFGLQLAQGVAIAIGYNLVAYAILGELFSGA